jgi:hypothetical protein
MVCSTPEACHGLLMPGVAGTRRSGASRSSEARPSHASWSRPVVTCPRQAGAMDAAGPCMGAWVGPAASHTYRVGPHTVWVGCLGGHCGRCRSRSFADSEKDVAVAAEAAATAVTPAPWVASAVTPAAAAEEALAAVVVFDRDGGFEAAAVVSTATEVVATGR